MRPAPVFGFRHGSEQMIPGSGAPITPRRLDRACAHPLATNRSVRAAAKTDEASETRRSTGARPCSHTLSEDNHVAGSDSSKLSPSSRLTPFTASENERSPRSRGSIEIGPASKAQATFRRSTLFHACGLAACASATNLASDKSSLCVEDWFSPMAGTPLRLSFVGAVGGTLRWLVEFENDTASTVRRCGTARIDRLEGKLKASQDEKLQDRVGTVCGLQKETSDDARSMAELVSQAIGEDAAGRTAS